MEHTTNQRRFIKYHKKVSLTMVIVNLQKHDFISLKEKCMCTGLPLMSWVQEFP